MCSPDEKLSNLNLTQVVFYSQEEEEAVAETDQEDWKTNADTQVRLDYKVRLKGDYKVKRSGNLKRTITLPK